MSHGELCSLCSPAVLWAAPDPPLDRCWPLAGLLFLEVKVEACKVQVAKPSSVVIAVVLFNLTAVFFTEMKPQAFVT